MHDPAEAKLVVSTETAGLGNRLKSWVSAMRLGPDVRVHWRTTEQMPAAFEDLFSNDAAVASIPPDATLYGSWRLAILPQDEIHLPAGFATAGAGAHPLIRGVGKAWWALTGRRSDRYRFMVYPKSYSRRSTRADARHIDFEYERIPPYFREVYRPLFRGIVVRPEIVQRAEQWASEKFGPDLIGVQVRTWRDDVRRHRKYFPPAWRRLVRLLDAVDRQSSFFVVSDSDDAVRQLQERYGSERVLHFPRSTARLDSWRSVDGVREDLIDMLLLARSSHLLATYFSTFGEAAWWLGGARATVAVF